MKLFKKSLAVLLVFALVFSTLSVAAFAAGEGKSVTAAVKFFRKVGSDWVETTKAKPGEALKARVFFKTDYAAADGEFITVFDSDFFSDRYANEKVKIDYNEASGYLTGAYTTKILSSNASSHYLLADMIDNGCLTQSIIDEGDFLISGYYTGDKAAELSGSWVLGYDLTVNDSAYVKTPGREGMARVPQELVASYENEFNYTNIPRCNGGVGSNTRDKTDMWDWDEIPSFESTPGYVSVFSQVILDANGGKIDGKDEKALSGVIGDEVKGLGLEENIPEKSGSEFKGWSLSENGTALTAAELGALEYDYEDITLYAVWDEAAPAAATYDIQYYKQEVDGETYTDPYATDTDVEGSNGVEVTLDPEAPTGFHVDTENSVLSGTPSVDNKLVLQVKYARNRHTVSYLDENGDPIKTYYDVPFGADIPGCDYSVPGASVSWIESYADNKMPDKDIEFNAKVTPEVYTYVFNALDGKFSDTGLASKSVAYGYNDVPSDPKGLVVAPEGKVFDKWDKEIPSKVTGSEVFNAIYKEKEYKVSYSVDGLPEGTTAPADQTGLTSGSSFTVAQLPDVGPGYTIDGWYNGDQKVEPGSTQFVGDDDIVLTAKVSDAAYTYTFDAGSGKFADGSAKKETGYNYGETPAYAEDPIAPSGYKFTGWDKSLPATVTGNEEFTAKYEALPLGVTYTVEGLPEGVEAPEGKEDLHIGDKFTVADLPDAGEGYEIDGWYNGDQKVEPGSEFEMTESSVELKAKCEPKEFKVTFDSDGGSEVADVPVKFGESLKNLPVPTKDGFGFDGWYDGDKKVESIDSMPAKDVALKAKWVADEYTITYSYTNEAPAGAPAAPAASTSPAGETITVAAAPSFEGYTFDGWYLNGEKVTSFDMPAKAVELTGSWKLKGGTVSYYLADGTEPIKTETLKEGDPIVLPEDPDVKGWEFKGWQLKDGSPVPPEMGTEDIDVYANLELKKFTVTYLVDGEEYEKFENVPFGSEVPVPAAQPAAPVSTDPEIENYFAGWTPTKPATMPDEDLVFNAQFASRTIGQEHIAKYIVDDGTYALYIIKAGDPMIKPEDPQKFGYKFIGWTPEVPAEMPDADVQYVAQFENDNTFIALGVGGAVVTGAVIGGIAAANTAAITGASIVGGVLVIAGISKLVKDTYTVKYIVNGEVYRTYKVLAGTKVPVPKDPSIDGAEFKGWTPEVPSKMPAQDLTFTAKFDNDGNALNPDTGSAATGLAAFAVISSAAAAAYVITNKKKEDEE